MLIKNFKRKQIIVQTLMGHSVRFAPGAEVEVPEALIEDCLKKGLMPSDDFKQAVKEASEEESITLAEEDAEQQNDDAQIARARARALEQAAIEAKEEAEAESKGAFASKKRSDTAKKAAATKAANKLKNK